MDRETLNAEQVELAAQLWALRQKGCSGRIEPQLLPAAVELEKRGFAERHRQDDQWLWRFTDAGEAAMSIGGLLTCHEHGQN